MSHFKHHVFFCINQRDNTETSCEKFCASRLQNYAKQRIAALQLNGTGKIRMNKSGCLDRCEQGPVMVVYPEAIWYTYLDESDIDEIIEQHLIAGKPVERLKLK